MKQAQYIFLSLAALTGLAACSSDSDLTPSSRSEGNAVVVKASVGKAGIFTRTNPAGTPEEQAKFNLGDVIALTDGTKTVNYGLALNEDGEETWRPINPSEYLVWGNGPMNFKAYYPVGDHIGGANSFDEGGVLVNQGGDAKIEDSDYMTATATTNKAPGNHTLNLEFERKTARVVVKIADYNDQFNGLEPQISSIDICGAYDASQQVIGILPRTITPNSEYMALVYPGDAKPNEEFLSIKVSHKDDGYGKTNTETDMSLKGIPAFEAGKSYTFSLTVGKDKLTVENVTVEDWATGAVISGGEATEKIWKISEATGEDLGKVVTADGLIYSTKADAEAAGQTAVAMIAYLGNDTGDDTYNHGLAIALDNVQTTIENGSSVATNFGTDRNLPAPTNSSNWKAPTVNNFKRIFTALSTNGYKYKPGMPTAAEGGFRMSDLQNRLVACGGNGIPKNQIVYTSDTYGEIFGKMNYWIISTQYSVWNYEASTTDATVIPIFAF